ncbi:N-acetyllactosaminide alpha-1,3-galactosyltransferase [Collichthys lucidus]|uniref:N-acetyllactosaminide alpha-1,3-galactosyltransferase n=1 Tax=Collichthys lucidus TaxID=240159 RepID=A0A4U5U5X0_COLLU|nr:N-acetyllactosaminide alpha-1,3-galactosyltransferase [Collichthys lucidus]
MLPILVYFPIHGAKVEWRTDVAYGARQNVKTRTTWNAPIMWEGMFDPNLYDQKHIEGESAVALTVFAVGRYLDAYLKTFLVSAEHHFMLGLPVTYYVFTDMPEKVPNIMLNAKRRLKIIQVQKYSRWQDISMMRMKTISEIIETDIRHHFSYVFCFDVDQEFKGRFGSEALGASVALLHAHFYNLPKEKFTYDKNPKSKAFMETSDYYYHAAIFGGLWENVKNLTDTCYVNIMEDKLYDVEALWHDESHLNLVLLALQTKQAALPGVLLGSKHCPRCLGNNNHSVLCYEQALQAQPGFEQALRRKAKDGEAPGSSAQRLIVGGNTGLVTESIKLRPH